MSEHELVPKDLIGENVVVDTNGQFVYMGRLERVEDYFFVLADADVHDSTDTSTPREIYVMDAKKYGVKRNRTSVVVLARHVVSLSLLSDVIEY